jgi:TM2 domain-containing membrane protein YozV
MLISAILITIAIYLATGLLFALFFLTKGVNKIDTGAIGSGWGFRIIILPGTIVLWPLLLNKWIKTKKVQHDKTAA